MSVDSPEKIQNRVERSDTELHIGLNVPRATARQIFLWAKQQPWPEETELEQPKDYHVTLLYSPEGHDEHKDAWWIEHLDNAEVKTKGVKAFPSPQNGGYAYVIELEADDVKQRAEEMQSMAEWAGLPISHFEGGYKPHVTIAYGPSSRLTGIKAPNFQFDIGPSSVSPPRPKEEKVSSRAPRPPHYRKGDDKKNCAGCKMMFEGQCWGYGNTEVEPNMVCDSFSPEGRTAFALDMDLSGELGLGSVASNLHYKFEEGLGATEVTHYAKQMLELIGYPRDELTVQAALETWQQLYPQDHVSATQYRVHEGQQSSNPQDPHRALMWLPATQRVLRGAPGSTHQDLIQEFDPLLRMSVDSENERKAMQEEQDRAQGYRQMNPFWSTQPHAIYGTQRPDNKVEWYGTSLHSDQDMYDREKSNAWHPDAPQVNAALGVQPRDWRNDPISPRACPQCGGDGWGPEPYHDNAGGCGREYADDRGPGCGGTGMAAGRPFTEPYSRIELPNRTIERGDPNAWRHDTPWISEWETKNPKTSQDPEKFGSRTGELSQSLSHKPLYHWLDAGDIHDWMDPSHTGPGQTYLTESGEDPGKHWNDDVPHYDNPVRLTIDPTHLDQNLFEPSYGGWLDNHLYQGPIPPEAVTDIKAFKRPDSWDQWSTVPTQVNNPEDHWPEFGEQRPDQNRDIEFSNDWNWHQ